MNQDRKLKLKFLSAIFGGLAGLPLLITIILSLILSSCSASYHVRKAMDKDPSLFADTLQDVQVLKAKPIDINFDPKLSEGFVVGSNIIELSKEVKVFTTRLLTRNDSIIIADLIRGFEIQCDSIIVTKTLPPEIIIRKESFFKGLKSLIIPMILIIFAVFLLMIIIRTWF